MSRKFSHIADSKAAIEVILALFRNVETVYNQGQEICLLDQQKGLKAKMLRKL